MLIIVFKLLGMVLTGAIALGALWIWKFTVDGTGDRRQLTRAGKIAAPLAAVALLLSISASWMEERRKAEQAAQAASDKELLRQLHDAILHGNSVSEEILLKLAARVGDSGTFVAVPFGPAGSVAPVGGGRAPDADACSTPPPFRGGLMQLRVATVRAEATARDLYARLYDRFGEPDAKSWQPWLQQPVPANIGSATVQMVAVNRVDPGAGAAMCRWLVRCNRWDPGLLPCDLRGAP